MILKRPAAAVAIPTPFNHWRFDNNLVDDQGVNDLTAGSALSYVAGKFGQAISCRATNEWAYFDNLLSLADALTFACWIRLPVDMTSGVRPIHAFGGQAQTDASLWHWRFQHNGSNVRLQLVFRIASEGPSVDDVSTNVDAMNDNAWHHIAITADGAQWQMFVNGVKRALTINNGENRGLLPKDTQALAPRRTTFGALFFNGAWTSSDIEMDHAYYYERVLSDAEIGILANE